MMLACDLEVRRDAASRREAPGAVGWGDPRATASTPEGPAREPAGFGGGEPLESAAPPEGGGAERQERAEPSTRRTTIRVLLVDDHAAVRTAFTVALNGEADLAVVGEAGSGAAALEEVRRLRPDVVLMDINLPGMSGIEVTRRIRAEFPQIAVIGLSMYESEEMDASIRTAGARGYVSKSASYDTLLAAIRASRNPDLV
jgi:CheY-like chemotaxis protein